MPFAGRPLIAGIIGSRRQWQENLTIPLETLADGLLVAPQPRRLNGPSFGRLGGALRRYPGGTENDSILRTVLRSTPNTREASRVLIPST